MVALDDQQRARLAAAVRRRQRDLNLTQLEVATAGGISQAAYNRIANGRADSIAERTIDALDRGLRWHGRTEDQLGSTETIILGGSPLPDDQPRALISEVHDERGETRRVVTAEPDARDISDEVMRQRWTAVWDEISAEPAEAARLLAIAETYLATRDSGT